MNSQTTQAELGGVLDPRRKEHLAMDYCSLSLLEFFTHERAARSKVYLVIMPRLRNMLKRVQGDYPTIGRLINEATKEDLLDYPRCGRRLTKSIQLMLATEGFALRPTS